MLALIGALREEVSDLRRQMSLVEVPTEPAYHLYRGQYGTGDVLLAQTGMGRLRAESATRSILSCYAVSALISLGFAGALAEGMEVGDVVVCAALHCATPGTQPAMEPTSYPPDDGLLRLAVEALEGTAVRFRIGSGVTVPLPISSPDEKLALGRASRADIVDMESYWLARIAAERGLPFLAVRTVSDTQRDQLPAFEQMLTAKGEWQRTKILAYFLHHPQHLIALPGLAFDARRARRSLTAVTDCLVLSYYQEEAST